MGQREACAWCGATDQLMVKLNQAKPVNACVDWTACGLREEQRNASKSYGIAGGAFGKMIFPSRREQRN